MAKFCGNCGAMMDDAAAVCGNCGAALAAAPAPEQKESPVAGIAGKATEILNGVKKGDKSSIIKIGVAAVAVIAVIILISSLSTSGSEKVIKKFIQAYDNEKPEAVVKVLPPFLKDAMVEAYGDEDDFLDEIDEEIKDFYDDMEDELDTDKLSFKYEIDDVEKYDKDEVEERAEAIESVCERYDIDFDEDKLKEVYEYEIEVTVKGGGDKEKVDLEMLVVKYGGKWYVLSYDWSY